MTREAIVHLLAIVVIVAMVGEALLMWWRTMKR